MNVKQKLQISSYFINNPKFAEYKTFFNYLDDDGSINNAFILAEPWRKKVFESEINKLMNNYETIKNNILIYKDDNDIIKQYELILNCFVEVFNIKGDITPKLYIVDKLPEPFSDKTWSAMSVDLEDEKIFNIPWGIYFVKNTITHGYFEILLAHELMHWIITYFSVNQKHIPFAPWIEEGIADFVGAYVLLKCDAVSKQSIVNFFACNRACCKLDDMKYSYWNACKQVMRIATTHGLEEILSIVTHGREYIAKIDLSKYKFTAGNSINFKDKYFADLYSVLLECQNYFTLNIDEYSVFESSFDGITSEKISETLLMNKNNINNILKLLEKKNLLNSIDGKFFNTNKSVNEYIKFSL